MILPVSRRPVGLVLAALLLGTAVAYALSPGSLRVGGAARTQAIASGFVVCLQPLGAHDPTLLEPVRRGITQAYGFDTRRLEPRPMPATAWYPPRQRHRALGVLDHLRAEVLPREPGCDAMVAITALDVSTPLRGQTDWGVLGLAYQGGSVAVVSSFRLQRGVERQRLVERAVKVVIHELGHVVGLPHREDGPGCIMNDAAGSVRGIDQAQGALCGPERAAAEQVLGRDLPDRGALDWLAIHQAQLPPRENGSD